MCRFILRLSMNVLMSTGILFPVLVMQEIVCSVRNSLSSDFVRSSSMSLAAALHPVVVGVSGGSGSGKTTFCRELVAARGEAKVLHLKQDNYYRDLSHMTPVERDAVNFDHPQALEFELLSSSS
ncbi:MAG: hypothetical protein FJY29_09165 [Betaproteobacteria bacterium]|nr:hypothetical protein [Betaproteobacteria bacterium]